MSINVREILVPIQCGRTLKPHKKKVKPKVSTTFKRKGKEKGNNKWFLCGEHGHLANDCPDGQAKEVHQHGHL